MPMTAAIVLAAMLVLFAGAALATRRGRAFTALCLIVSAAACIYFYAASEHALNAWDERYHALVAKHLISHPLTPTLYEDPVLPYDYRDWGANHVWLHKPPVALWLMAASVRVLGTTELAARLPSVLLSLAAIVVTFA